MTSNLLFYTSEKGSILKGKNLFPERSTFFHFKRDSFEEEANIIHRVVPPPHLKVFLVFFKDYFEENLDGSI